MDSANLAFVIKRAITLETALKATTETQRRGDVFAEDRERNEIRETGSIEFEHRMNPFSFTSWVKTTMPGQWSFSLSSLCLGVSVVI